MWGLRVRAAPVSVLTGRSVWLTFKQRALEILSAPCITESIKDTRARACTHARTHARTHTPAGPHRATGTQSSRPRSSRRIRPSRRAVHTHTCMPCNGRSTRTSTCEIARAGVSHQRARLACTLMSGESILSAKALNGPSVICESATGVACDVAQHAALNAPHHLRRA